MAETTAWRLNFGAPLQAAVGELQLIHIFDDPELFEVPCAPPHCHQVLVWQNDVLPVLDIEVWSGPSRKGSKGFMAGIVAYQQGNGQPVQFGSIKIVEPPRRIRVNDDNACEVPEESEFWTHYSLASFADPDFGVLPVLNLPRLFSTELATSSPEFDRDQYLK